MLNFFCLPCFGSMEMWTIFDFRALTKVHTSYNFKTASSNSEKLHAHVEDIHMNKHRDAFLLLLHNTFLIIFVCEKHNKNSTKFQIF